MRPHITDKSTYQEKLDEFYYCKNNPIYFIERYVKIPEAGDDVLMKLYEPQKVFLRSILNDHYVIALKSRQVGISTITQAYSTYVQTFYRNIRVSMVSRNSDESTEFCMKVKDMIHKLPDWLRPKMPKEREQEFKLDNGSAFHASQVNEKNPGALFRGPATTIAIIDEAAHINLIDEAFTGFGPSLIKAQSVALKKDIPFATIIISTPNKMVGTGKWFFDSWSKANSETGDSIYKPHKIHWTEVEEFANDPNWYKTQCEVLQNNPQKIAQELEMKFLASHDSFFPPETIEILNECGVEPKSKMHIKGNYLHQWEPANKDSFYIIGIDSASLSGNDNSAIQVINFETFNQAAEYQGKMRVDDFCTTIDIINKIYPRNILVVEANTYGNQVVEHLTRRPENYTLYTQKVHNMKTVNAGTRYRYGLHMSHLIRPLVLDSVFTYVHENPHIVKSKRLALELMGLIENKNGKVLADKGMNDDLVLALGFCAYVRSYDPPLGISNVGEDFIDDVMRVASYNDDSGVAGAVSGLKNEKMDTWGTNKVLQNHIKQNLIKLTNNGTNAVIDINKLLGFDIMDGDNGMNTRNKN